MNEMNEMNEITDEEARQLVLDTAKEEASLQITEDAGENEDLAGNLAKYRTAVTDAGLDPDRGPEPWCADFVSWVFLQAERPLGPEGKGFSSCSRMAEWLEETGRAFYPGCLVPVPGDLALFDLNDNGKPDHVGIVERIDGHGRLYTYEGNYNDGCRSVCRPDVSKVYCFGRIIR